MVKLSRGEKLFGATNVVVLGAVALLCLYPFVYTLSISLSTAAEANRDGFHFFPRDISLVSYRMVLTNPNIVTGYMNTLLRTVLGTSLTLAATCIAAYPLSRREMPHRAMLTFLVVFTMLFSGGMVPAYLLVKNLGMINTVWALTVPGMITAFNVIIVKNFFQSLPESLVESARLDGAGEWTILFRLYLPLSKPVLATVALWTAVGHWNAWFDALLYITDDRKQVLQTFLQRIVIESSTQMMELGITDTSIVQFTSETIKAATIIVTILPIICVYPFVQKYFVKGIMLGGVKG
ncbi:MAG: carbohydrate ABC transporter permease [Lentisphaerae bacterium]|nr:carbohydrate ABC transporter permease [Lentisphaerota bacterium]MBT4820532.1 carbohydrate ABC transporter permease [Lentisphaerota bacterium]MBT5604336.1 carbohydrate ABC transporter permease [Lentisphaerota bacterium]MBT7055079.1 carbohydrate ABC transporter permease [Lentisphaerota bacterium]MBT7840892.1 carbohydrate ABC transporter permease [Lentisphaerota bacterium]